MRSISESKAKGSLKTGSLKLQTRLRIRTKAYAKHWADLTPKEKGQMVRSLSVLRAMRKGESLTFSAKRVGIDRRALKSYLGSSIYKKGHRWEAQAER